MIKIPHPKDTTHHQYFQAAAEIAQQATCHRAHCGSVIVTGSEIIGTGYNSPPGDKESNRTCNNQYSLSGPKAKFDKTCCMHAEWRAVIDACRRSPDKLPGSTLYFMRVDERGGFTAAGEPFCTTCSRFAVDVGIATFTLWNEDGTYLYDADEYNQASYQFHSPLIPS